MKNLLKNIFFYSVLRLTTALEVSDLIKNYCRFLSSNLLLLLFCDPTIPQMPVLYVHNVLVENVVFIAY